MPLLIPYYPNLVLQSKECEYMLVLVGYVLQLINSYISCALILARCLDPIIFFVLVTGIGSLLLTS